MKVVQINAVYGIMSTGRNVMEISNVLTNEGHECLTFYGNHPGNYQGDTRFMGSFLSHKVHALTSRLFADAGKGSIFATRRLVEFLSEYKPDIVHLNNLHGNFIHINKILNYLADNDIATVVHLHDCFFFTGGCMHYTVNNCYKWQTDCNNCRFLSRGKDFIFKNRASRNLKNKIHLFNAIPRLAVCGVSKWTEQEARRSPVFAKAKIITHIYNWIDLNLFKPQSEDSNKTTRKRLGIDNQIMLLGVASGWGNAKGLDDFNALARQMPDAKIVLVGKMPADVKLEPNIISVGATDSVIELARLYSAADVFVHLSREETFGKVVAESLACGTPAVVYDSTALPELIDENTGRVINPGDIETAVQAIHNLRSQPHIGQSCRKRAELYFDMKKNIQKQIEVYQNLINY